MGGTAGVAGRAAGRRPSAASGVGRYPVGVAERSASPRVALVTLGCARNDVDSEELAGRLAADGWEVGADAEDADVVVVNTCTFVEQAKKDSVDAVLAAGADGTRVVAVGCMAERYGAELAEALPEAAAVLGFDHYGDLPARLDDVMAGRPLASHTPTDRRTLLPISPVKRPEAVESARVPGHGWMPEIPRRRLDDAPVAPLKLASGCDRRCAFCAIPSFRGAFVSRAADDVVAEAAWLADHGVAEVLLVSENSTSYGKDIDARGAAGGALERLLGDLATVPGMKRVRVSYLQPAEVRPPLLAAIATTPGIAPYFDLSFQHASAAVLRRMRRFGSREAFLSLCAEVRALAPEAGIRSNVIVGFPGETEDDLAELEAFLSEAELDAVGVFGYSDEDGTEAADLPDKVDPRDVAARVERITSLADHVAADRAARRVGTAVEVLVERFDDEEDAWVGRAAHQGPDVDGECVLVTDDDHEPLAPGMLVAGTVVESEGVDLVVEVGDGAAGDEAERSSTRGDDAADGAVDARTLSGAGAR